MPDAYLVALVLATALFLYVVFQKVKNGQAISTSLLYVPLLLGIAFLFYKIWADGQKIAKLQTEVEQKREKEKDLVMRMAQVKIETEQKVLEKQIQETAVDIQEARSLLEKEKTRHAKAVAVARGVRTWEGFWSAVGRGDEGPADPDSGGGRPG